MRQHFIVFLHEHGLVRPMAPAAGVACINHAGFHIRLGYELGVGFYDWTGNDLRLEGTITTKGRLRRSLQASVVQPDDLLPAALRTALRTVALQKLSRIVDLARANGRDVPAQLLAAIRKSEVDHLYVPDFRYQAEEDLKRWCETVRPHIPDCIRSIKSEAERLRQDATTEA